MTVLLLVAAVLVLGGSFYADYKWRQWMAERKRERGR
jgi:hypothetical protein